MILFCPCCRKGFLKKTPNQKYCSEKCAKKDFRQKYHQTKKYKEYVKKYIKNQRKQNNKLKKLSDVEKQEYFLKKYQC
jgi:uncharacterized protein YeaO (DUF488 family)